MATEAPQSTSGTSPEGASASTGNIALPQINIRPPRTKTDLATVLGLLFAIGFIAAAIFSGQSDANFFNVPALLIVLFGTIAATSISYTPDELARAGSIIGKSLVRKVYDAPNLARSLVDLAIVARKKGLLALTAYDQDLRRNPFLARAIQLVVDGYNPEDINRLLGQEIDAQVERHKRSASITTRASEIAPAMGLIGTLVGLVQMLADLENPEMIGPSMAVALLTTFYGAILGTIIMAPLAEKLRKNSADETRIKTIIKIAAVSIASQDNPRRLEMLINSELPPSERINYFE